MGNHSIVYIFLCSESKLLSWVLFKNCNASHRRLHFLVFIFKLLPLFERSKQPVAIVSNQVHIIIPMLESMFLNQFDIDKVLLLITDTNNLADKIQQFLIFNR